MKVIAAVGWAPARGWKGCIPRLEGESVVGLHVSVSRSYFFTGNAGGGAQHRQADPAG